MPERPTLRLLDYKNTLVMLIATALILGGVFYLVPMRATWAALRGLPWGISAAAMVVSLVFNVGLYADRWRRTLSYIGIRLSLADALRIHLATGPLRLLFPIQTGELITAAVAAKKADAPVAVVAGAIAYNKYLTLLATLLMLGIAAAMHPGAVGPLGAAVGLAGLAAFLAVGTLNFQKVREGLARLLAKLPFLTTRLPLDFFLPFDRLSRPERARLLAYSFVFQCSEIISCALIFHALKIPLSFWDLVAVVQVIVLVSNLPITIAGVGTREGAALVLLGALTTNENAVAAGVAFSFFEYLWPMLVGLIWLPGLIRRPRSNSGGGPD
ncbi:MAG: flippase-like domain-containing protein [Deltaproteobacteria bacterium]|nr:flippase-like domain-containing protein [Deltaproteobacteria bacterium]